MLLLEYKPKKYRRSVWRLDLTDKYIGKYHVIKKDENIYGNWKCICECGNRISIKGSRLIKNEREFCKECKPKKNKENKSRFRICVKCGNSYEMSINAKHSKYCSRICYKSLKKSCKVCGNVITVKKGPENIYCSLECKIKNHYRVNTDGCWIWIGVHESSHGSKIQFNGKRYSFTRIAYELCKSKIPDGMFLTRKCKNYKCVNPDHHIPVTKEIFFRECNHNNVTKKINIEIVLKIIDLHESGFTPQEILEQYTKAFKYKSFIQTAPKNICKANNQ